jgi:hypothetical protein
VRARKKKQDASEKNICSACVEKTTAASLQRDQKKKLSRKDLIQRPPNQLRLLLLVV